MESSEALTEDPADTPDMPAEDVVPVPEEPSGDAEAVEPGEGATVSEPAEEAATPEPADDAAAAGPVKAVAPEIAPLGPEDTDPLGETFEVDGVIYEMLPDSGLDTNRCYIIGFNDEVTQVTIASTVRYGNPQQSYTIAGMDPDALSRATQLETVIISRYLGGTLGGVTVGPGTLTTGYFHDMPSLKSVSLPTGYGQLGTIEARAFQNCPNLQTINIPRWVTTVEPYAFDRLTANLVLAGGDDQLAQWYDDCPGWEQGFEGTVNGHAVEDPDKTAVTLVGDIRYSRAWDIGGGLSAGFIYTGADAGYINGQVVVFGTATADAVYVILPPGTEPGTNADIAIYPDDYDDYYFDVESLSFAVLAGETVNNKFLPISIPLKNEVATVDLQQLVLSAARTEDVHTVAFDRPAACMGITYDLTVSRVRWDGNAVYAQIPLSEDSEEVYPTINETLSGDAFLIVGDGVFDIGIDPVGIAEGDGGITCDLTIGGTSTNDPRSYSIEKGHEAIYFGTWYYESSWWSGVEITEDITVSVVSTFASDSYIWNFEWVGSGYKATGYKDDYIYEYDEETWEVIATYPAGGDLVLPTAIWGFNEDYDEQTEEPVYRYYDVTAVGGLTGNPYVTGLTLPSTVTTIDAGAFADCENLAYVEIPASVVNAGAGLISNEYPTELRIATLAQTAGWDDDWFGATADTTATVFFGGEEYYEVRFDANGYGGDETTVAWVKAGAALSTLGSLPAPEDEGYDFDGWYTAASGGTKVSDGDVLTGHTTLYAHWSEKDVAEPEAAVITVGSPEQIYAGDTALVRIPVSISNNVNGFTAFMLSLDYDEELVFAGLDYEGAILSGLNEELAEGGVLSYTSVADITENGLMFTLLFDVSSTPAGTYDVTVGLRDGLKANFSNEAELSDGKGVPVTFVSGQVAVVALASTTLGDLIYALNSPRTYNAEPQAVTVTGKDGIGAVTVWYEGKDGSGTTYAKSQAAPVDAGVYTVTVDVAATGSHQAADGLVLGDLTVAKAPAPQVTWPTASAITYGDAISASTLSGGTAGYGTFAWAASVDTAQVPEAGTYSYGVTFTPDAATLKNYEAIETLTQAVALVVNQAPAPEIAWPAASAITYGDAISASTLSGGTAGYGTFAWAASVDTAQVPEAGTYSYDVTFTPDAATLKNYEAIEPLTQAVSLTVNKAPAPEIAWPTASAITYGNAISASALLGGTEGYGTFAWAASVDTAQVPDAGAHTYDVTFTPDAATLKNYEEIQPLTLAVALKVNKAPAPQVTWPTAADLVFGQTLAESALSGGSTQYGDFAWVNGALKPYVPGGPFAVAFTPNAKTVQNYEPITGTQADVHVTVAKAPAPAFDWPTAAAITYGDPLSGAVLSFAANDYGTFAWDDAAYDADAVPDAGAYAYGVTFTQTDGNYQAVAPATRSVAVTVNKAPAPQITWPTSSGLSVGQTLSQSPLVGGSTEYGSFAWADGTTVMAAAGTFGYPVAFTPNAGTAKNYEAVIPSTKDVDVVVAEVLGDANGNGVADASDAAIALRVAMGIWDVTPALLAALDIDRDGVITAADVVNISRLAAGKNIVIH
ncbi:MAG: leucine-rich repeat protein [Clostridiales Family XIII bacterium]|nr:leucine-rich repeat protein [Clostridiales Family XIII bacterium]